MKVLTTLRYRWNIHSRFLQTPWKYTKRSWKTRSRKFGKNVPRVVLRSLKCTIFSLSPARVQRVESLGTISTFYPVLRMHVELVLSQKLLKTCVYIRREHSLSAEYLSEIFESNQGSHPSWLFLKFSYRVNSDICPKYSKYKTWNVYVTYTSFPRPNAERKCDCNRLRCYMTSETHSSNETRLEAVNDEI